MTQAQTAPVGIAVSAPITGRRTLQFLSADDAIADLNMLRNSRLIQRGNWTLPQACWHLSQILESTLRPPATEVPTPEEAAFQKRFIDLVLGPMGVPLALPTPATAVPPPSCKDAEIDRLIAVLQSLKTYGHAYTSLGRAGPVKTEEYRQLTYRHVAHHLSFFVPIHRRDDLRFNDIASIKSDVEQLHRGYAKTGEWTLNQICWHCRIAIDMALSAPIAPATPEQLGNRDLLSKVLARGRTPEGLQAPPPAIPPADCDDAEVAEYFTALLRLDALQGQAVHRKFGPISANEFKRVQMAHAAHHLSYLVPTAV